MHPPCSSFLLSLAIIMYNALHSLSPTASLLQFVQRRLIQLEDNLKGREQGFWVVLVLGGLKLVVSPPNWSQSAAGKAAQGLGSVGPAHGPERCRVGLARRRWCLFADRRWVKHSHACPPRVQRGGGQGQPVARRGVRWAGRAAPGRGARDGGRVMLLVCRRSLATAHKPFLAHRAALVAGVAFHLSPATAGAGERVSERAGATSVFCLLTLFPLMTHIASRFRMAVIFGLLVFLRWLPI